MTRGGLIGGMLGLFFLMIFWKVESVIMKISFPVRIILDKFYDCRGLGGFDCILPGLGLLLLEFFLIGALIGALIGWYGGKRTRKKVGGAKNPWFRKREGADLKKGSWGFIPINWNGWLALALLIIVNVFAALSLGVNIIEWKRWSKFIIIFLLSLLVFILIAKNKTLGVKDDI